MLHLALTTAAQASVTAHCQDSGAALASNDLCITSALFGLVPKVLARAYFKARPRLLVDGGDKDVDAGSCRSHLELSVLLLEVLVFVRVAVWKLVDLDAVLLDLLTDLWTKGKERIRAYRHLCLLNGCADEQTLEVSLP